MSTEPAWTFFHRPPWPNPRPLSEVDHDIEAARLEGLTRAHTYLAQGKPGRAAYELARSVEHQARIAGAGSWTLPIDRGYQWGAPATITHTWPTPPTPAMDTASRGARFLDALLGPRCPRCWLRVFPKDQAAHDQDCT